MNHKFNDNKKEDVSQIDIGSEYIGNEETEYIYMAKTEYQNIEEDEYKASSKNKRDELMVVGKLVENQNGKLIFPERIERLGNGSFEGCHSLKNIELPNALREIGDQCFMWCDIRSLDFTNCKNLRSIGASAFRGCQYITDILIPEGVEKVGSWCLSGMTLLKRCILS